MPTITGNITIADLVDGAPGNDGVNGSRGPGWWRYETGTSASTAGLSTSAVNSLFSTATGFIPVEDDRFILVNTSDSATAYLYSSSSSTWVAQAAFIDGNLLVNGTVTAGQLDTNSMNVAGLAVFNDRLQSSNFVTDVSGWMIDDSGDMEINNLVVRESVVVGAVSNGVTYATSTSQKLNNNTTVAIPALGAMSVGEFFQIAVRVVYSYYSKNQASSYSEKGNTTTYSTQTKRTKVSLQRRIDSGSWETVGSSGYTTGTNTLWETTFSMHGDYTNVELRLLVNTNMYYTSGGDGSGLHSPDNIVSLAVVGRALVR